MSHIHYNNWLGLPSMTCVISPMQSVNKKCGIPEMHLDSQVLTAITIGNV